MPEVVLPPARSYAPGIGVYRITNLVNGRAYIGSSRYLERRFQEHQYLLENGRHHNRRLQREWRVHGREAFLFEVLEFAESIDNLLLMEQRWLDAERPHYNICLVASSRAGVKASAETRAKIRDAKLNMSEETRRKIGEANRRRGPEWRAKLSAAHTGKKLSEETRQKVAEANRRRPQEVKNKCGHGKKHTSEARQRMREIALGRVISPEQREKIRAALTGSTRSEETRQRMRDSRQAYLRRKASL